MADDAIGPRRADPARKRNVHGILLLDKPPGVSSNRALQVVRRALRAAKGGHTGNLDVAASGLLPLCFGEATKISNLLLDSSKRYLADIQLGRTTTTGDLEGDVIATSSHLPTATASVEEALTHFRGELSQIPPMYSALKHQGQPLYKLARRGIEIPRAPRTVQIYRLTLESFSADRVQLDITCSKGTYIRTLAIDLGAYLGCGATLAGLRRVAVGPFNLGQAHALDTFMTDTYSASALDELLLPLDTALSDYAPIELGAAMSAAFAQGQIVRLDSVAPGMVRVYGHRQQLLGIGTVDADSRLQPRRVMHLD